MNTNPGRRRPRPRPSSESSVSLPYDDLTGELPSFRTGPMTATKKWRRRRQQRYDDYETKSALLCCMILCLLILIGILMQAAVSQWFLSSSTPFERQYAASFALVDKYASLYHETYTLAMERILPPDHTVWPPVASHSSYQLTKTYASPQMDSCSVTVLVMDDTMGRPLYDYGNGQSIWFVLESIGAFAPPDACISLITSDCAMKEYIMSSSSSSNSGDIVYEQIAKGIYQQSLPLFRTRIEEGRVRLSLLNHDKYPQIRPYSSDYSSSNPVLMHRSFWDDEFDEERDSDLVLVMDRTAVLCYPLILPPAGKQQYAFVGSVWAQGHNPLIPDSLEGPCREMAKSWHSWLWPQRKYLKDTNPKESSLLPLLLRDEFPTMCEGHRAPVGSGGMSLRSRQWMIRAIETCPHVTYSGMDSSDEFVLPCKVFDPVSEDYYFATILQGIDAPMPSAYEATLFAAEMFWPDELIDVYQQAPTEDEQTLAANRPKITSMDGALDLVIPNGVHNVWWYHPEEMLRSEIMAESCPFLPYIYDTRMNRYDEFTAEQEVWIGVGS